MKLTKGYEIDLQNIMRKDSFYEIRDENSDSSFFKLAYGKIAIKV